MTISQIINDYGPATAQAVAVCSGAEDLAFSRLFDRMENDERDQFDAENAGERFQLD